MNQIKHGQFLTNLHACSEDMEYVASKIKDIIIAEIKQKGMCVEIIPDVQRLVRMGFKSDAITLVVQISDYSVAKIAITRLAMHCVGYGEALKSGPVCKINIDSCETENDIITVIYSHADDNKWITTLIHVNQLKSFYEFGHLLSVEDSVDHTGEHVLKLSNVPFDRINEYDYQELVKDYIQSGYEVVTM